MDHAGFAIHNPSMPNRCAVHVGRLLEIRVTEGYRTVADVDAVFDQIPAELRKIPEGQRVVIITDWRRCPVMSSDASEHAIARMVRNNSKVERSAALGPRESSTAVLQFMRLVRDSQLPTRRLFFDADETCRWLSEVLEPAEGDRLRRFLAEGDAVLGRPSGRVG